MENPIKMDDLGGPPLFLETSKYVQPEDPMSFLAESQVILDDFAAKDQQHFVNKMDHAARRTAVV